MESAFQRKVSRDDEMQQARDQERERQSAGAEPRAANEVPINSRLSIGDVEDRPVPPSDVRAHDDRVYSAQRRPGEPLTSDRDLKVHRRSL